MTTALLIAGIGLCIFLVGVLVGRKVAERSFYTRGWNECVLESQRMCEEIFRPHCERMEAEVQRIEGR
jgi:hypothetical protein